MDGMVHDLHIVELSPLPAPFDELSRLAFPAVEPAPVPRTQPVLRGHLDAVTTTGYVEGWAFDAAAIDRPLHLQVLHDGVPVASGLAHRYRTDLVDAGCGTGWCAFRFRVAGSVTRLKAGTFHLHDLRSGAVFCETRNLKVLEDGGDQIGSVDALLDEDPTVAVSIAQLRGCDDIFNRYIRMQGVEAFIRRLYSYVLNRPADMAGTALYAGHIRRATLTPFEVAAALADSDEFRSRRPTLIAPTSPGFPFNVLA